MPGFNASKFDARFGRNQETEAQRIERQARETAQAHEAKIGRGPTRTETVPDDVYSRLKKMGVSHDNIREAAAAYANIKDAYARNPDLTSEQLLEDLKVRGYHENAIKAMEPFFKTVEPIVRADLGQSKVASNFPDEISRRNFLIANHFSPEEINKELGIWNSQQHEYQKQTGSFYLPDAAKERINKQQIKHAEAKVKRSNAQQEERHRLEGVQKHTDQTIPGQSQEKTAMDLAQFGAETLVGAYGRGHQKFGGERFAKKTNEEKEAERLNKVVNPFTKEQQQRQQKLEEITGKHFGKESIKKSAEPFLNKATADLDDDYQRRFGNAEDKFESSIIDKMNRNYLEKIAPSIKQKYLTPGVRGHGHIKKEVDESLRQAHEGTADAITAHRIAHRGQNYGITANERERQLKGAELSGNLTKGDISSDLAVKGALEESKNLDDKRKLDYAARIGSIGENNKATEQEKLNDTRQEFRDEVNHAEKFGRAMIDSANANPVSALPNEEKLPRPKRTGLGSTAGGFMGLGAGLINGKEKEKTAKRGGRIYKAEGGSVLSPNHSKYVTPKAMIGYLKAKNNRVMLATGGAVDPDLIQNAVFDQVAPTTELMRDNRRNRLNQLKDQYDNSRKKYAVGGEVSPLTQGISMAKNVVAEDEKEKYLKEKVNAARERIINPVAEEEDHPLKRALTGFMRGATATGNDDWVARSGKAYTAVDEAHQLAKEKKRKHEQEHQKSLLQVGRDYQKERETEKSHELAKQKQAHDELMGESTRNYQTEHSKLFKAQADKLKGGFGENGEHPDDMPTKFQTEKSKSVLDKSRTIVDAAKGVARNLDPLLKTAIKLDSGPNIGKANEWVGPTLTSAFSNVKQKDLTDMHSQSTSAIHSIQGLEKLLGESGGGKLAQALKIQTESKPDPGKTRNENIRLTLGLYSGVEDVLKSEKIKRKSHGASRNEIKDIDEALAEIQNRKQEDLKTIESWDKEKQSSHASVNDSHVNSNVSGSAQKAAAQKILESRGVKR